MQDKNVKLPFMHQPPVPNITKFDDLRIHSKKFIISLEKKLRTHVVLKRKNRISERRKQNQKVKSLSCKRTIEDLTN